MDEIACDVDSIEQLIPTLQLIYKCLRTSKFELSLGRGVFGSEKVCFLGKVVKKTYNLKKKPKVKFPGDT